MWKQIIVICSHWILRLFVMQQRLTNMVPLYTGSQTPVQLVPSLIWLGFNLHMVRTAVSEKEQGSDHGLLMMRVTLWGNKLWSDPRCLHMATGDTVCKHPAVVSPVSLYIPTECWTPTPNGKQSPVMLLVLDLRLCNGNLCGLMSQNWYWRLSDTNCLGRFCKLGKRVVLSLYLSVWRTCEEAYLLWLGLAEDQSRTVQRITWEPKINRNAAVDDRKLSTQRQRLGNSVSYADEETHSSCT